MRQTLGEEHPMSLSAAINLSNCLADAAEPGRGGVAAAQHPGALTKVLGPDHPDTLICQANLAVTLRDADGIRRGGAAGGERARAP